MYLLLYSKKVCDGILSRQVFQCIKQTGLDCLDSCVVNILQNKVKDYEFVFYDMLYFGFNDSIDSELIAPKICGGMSNIKKYSFRFFQLCFSKATLSHNIDEIFQIDIEMCYYFVRIKPEKCNWLKEYQIHDIPHFVILLKREENGFSFADPQFTEKTIFFEEKTFFEAYAGHLKAFFLLRRPAGSVDVKELLLKEFHAFLYSLKPHKNYNALIKAIIQNNSLSSELHVETPYIQSIEYKLSYQIPGMRFHFDKFIKLFYLSFFSSTNNMKSALELSEKNNNDWMIVKALIQKIKYTGRIVNEINLLIQRFQAIADNEQRLCEQLKTSLKTLGYV